MRSSGFIRCQSRSRRWPAMMLVDEGKMSLDDPLSKFIPAFADARVAVEKRDGDGNVEARHRTCCAADQRFSISCATPPVSPTASMAIVRFASSMTPAELFDGDIDNAQLAERIARLPLAEQPGTLWDYGHSTDILGRVIEVISGKSLYEFEKSGCSILSGCLTRPSRSTISNARVSPGFCRAR